MNPNIKYITALMPDRETPHGRAWRADLKKVAKERAEANPDLPAHATLDAWLVEAKWAHPFWGNYLITLVHLRDGPGLPPPKIHREGATHEIVVAAVDPDCTPDPTSFGGVQTLRPLNFLGQFTATDLDAVNQLERVIDDILAAKLNPDTDGRAGWVARFGSHCFKSHIK